MSCVEEYKGFYALFYLKARSKPRPNLADPVLRYYRWWVAVYNTTWSRVEEILANWRPLGKRSKVFKEILSDGELDVLLPAHDPPYYAEFATELGAKVSWIERRLKVENTRVVVKFPVIDLPNSVAEHVFSTFSAALTTYKNPSLAAHKVVRACFGAYKWADWIGIPAILTFKETRSPDYAFNGYKRVVRFGKAFLVLTGVRR